jgi:hypothetical protein
MHALEHSSIHVRATKFEDAARRHNACGSACMKPPCWHARGAAPKPREVAGLRGTTMQLVSSHMCARLLVDVEIITGDLLQTAQGLRSTGLQSSFGISRAQAKVDKTATSPPLNGCTASTDLTREGLCREWKWEWWSLRLAFEMARKADSS